ncbi:MAG TPA: NCS1 family nucleobase:cation symporter-1 [Pseudonocardiaceae bacterium]|nr:NCS1 family nucleobase:cation symporter-1 [Pseudonocardiaceae bacterium]
MSLTDANPAEAAQITHPDGRVELADPAAIADSPYANPELAPLPVAKRTWSTYNFAALWIGMSHNLATYSLASGLVATAVGMSPWQALMTIAIANCVVLIPMLLNSHAGTKYGIPFPVYARAFFGIRGANLAALLRAFVACGWFGIQTWIGGQGVYTIAGALLGGSWKDAASVGGQPWTLWLSFAVFWVLQLAVIWRGMQTLRRFENWAAPAVLVVFVALLIWVLTKTSGVGPLLNQPAPLGWGAHFWIHVFAPSLMSMIAFWATMSLNMPDFTRFAASQKGQRWGQILGLPTTMTFFSLISVLIASGTAVLYGKAVWDPIDLGSRFSNPVILIIGLATVLIATMSTNVAANVVSPSYDFSHVLPKWINFRTGGLITGIVGVIVMPWKLYSDPSLYIFTWLGFYGGVLGAVAGVLICGYWVIRRTDLSLTELYRPHGRYWFTGGWNIPAVIATVIGAVLAVGGAYGGPFPAGGLIPALKPLYDYNWAVGFVAAFLVYLAFSLPERSKATAALSPAVATQD